MPTYDYQCRACGSVTEVIHSMLEDGPKVCERCGGELRRVLYPTGIIFKGSGFYRNDARSASGGASSAKRPAGSEGSSSAPATTDGGAGGSTSATTSTDGAAPSTPTPSSD